MVDDDRTILKYVAHMLAMLGLQEVQIAQRQPEVMNKLIAGCYTLSITDLEMPDMNGYHLVHFNRYNADRCLMRSIDETIRLHPFPNEWKAFLK